MTDDNHQSNQHESSQSKQCEFCKTSVDKDALVCSSCGATHLYYQHPKDTEGEPYEQALATRKKISGFYHYSPKGLAAMAIIIALFWGLAALTWGGDFSFFMALIGFLLAILFSLWGIAYLLAAIGHHQLYDQPQAIWRRQI